FGDAEAVGENEAVILLEEAGEAAGDDFGVDFIRVGQEGDAVALAHSEEELFHAGHGAVEEVAPGLAELFEGAAVAGGVADEVVEVEERDGAALHVAIAAAALEDLDELIARGCRVAADALQHALVGELDERVAEVEDKPDWRHGVMRLPGRPVARQPGDRV